jgi:hypothetical protein
MIGNSLVTQIIVAGLAIGIIITYIKPSITEIGVLQDKIAKTMEELEKVNAVNQKLASLVSAVGAISPKDKQSLSTYLPETFDEVEVMKDLEAITKDSGAVVSSLTYSGEAIIKSTSAEGSEELVDLPMGHNFSLTISSSYEQMKYLLLLLERNNYPLDIQNLSISPTEGGLLDLSLELRTYSYK